MENRKRWQTDEERWLPVAFVAAASFLAWLNGGEISLFAFVARVADDVEAVDADEDADVVVEAKKVEAADYTPDTRRFPVFRSRRNYHTPYIELVVVAAMAVVAVAVVDAVVRFRPHPC